MYPLGLRLKNRISMIRMAIFREKEREKSACFKDVISVNILIGDASFMGKRLMCLGHKAKAHRHPHFTYFFSSFQGLFQASSAIALMNLL